MVHRNTCIHTQKEKKKQTRGEHRGKKGVSRGGGRLGEDGREKIKIKYEDMFALKCVTVRPIPLYANLKRMGKNYSI